MNKLTFDEAMEAISEERPIDSERVQASALRRKVWVARWQFVGCLPDWYCYGRTKAEAIDAAVENRCEGVCEGAIPYGMAAALKRGEAYATNDGHAYYIVERVTLSDLL